MSTSPHNPIQQTERRPIAFITGTSSGFGLLTSVALAQKGYHVIATMRNLNRKLRLLEAASAAGVSEHIEVIQLDVTDAEGREAVVQDILNRYGAIEVLINNAGFALGGFVEEVPLSEWRRQFETNVFGVIAITQAVLSSMRERRKGYIINISSISGRIAFPGLGPYAASKYALEGFSEALRMEMSPYGVRVVLVEPASYKTDVWEKGLQEASVQPDTVYPREAQVMMKTVQDIARTGGDPDEVVRLIEQILSTEKPKLRYPIGRGVRGMLLAKTVLPWRFVERTVGKRFQ